MARARSHELRLLRRLLDRARPYRLHLTGILLLGLLSTPLALLAPVPLKIAVDSVIGDHPLPALLRPLAPGGSAAAVLGLALGLLLAVALLAQVQDLAAALLRTYTGERLVLSLRSELFRHVQRLSLSYADSAGTADSTYRIQYDAPAIQTIAIEGVIPFVTSSVTVAAMIAVSAGIDWQLAMVALAISPMLFALTWHYRRRLRHRWREVKKLQSDAHSHVSEVLSALRVVKAFGQEDREHDRFMERSRRGVSARLRADLVEGVFGIFVGLVTAGGTAAVLLLGVRHVQAGLLTLGDLLLVMGYLAQLYGPLKTMSRKAGRLQSHLASAERAFKLLDEAPDVEQRPRARPLRRAGGAVVFRDVGFDYGDGRAVLRDVRLEVPAGGRVGVAGRTGAGKTTLVSLLPRFYDPTAGAILLDGVDLRDWRLADLRRQFAIVLQEPLLFSTSIAENIAYARPGAGRRDVEAAAAAAGAAEFIETLPGGYDTTVGERGMRLSGGERQRIAIARAFLADAPILILDEPTSALDIKTENAILDAIDRLMRGRTTFLIAHRPGTLDLCDVRVRVEDGRLAELPHAAEVAP